MSKQIEITINGEKVSTKAGVSILKVLEDHPHLLPAYQPVCASVNNRIVGLYHRLYSNCSVELFGYRHRHGRIVWRRTACLIMYAAFKELHPEWDLEIGQSLENGYFFEIKPHSETDPSPPREPEGLRALAKELEEKMHEIIQADHVLRPVLVATDEAREYFHRIGRIDKMMLLDVYSRPEVEWIILRQFRDLVHGPVAPRTGMIRNFTLKAYPPGLLLRFPSREDKKPTAGRPARKLFQIYRETREWNELVGVWNVGLLNRSCINGQISEVIKIAEALHEKKLAQIADTIYDRLTQVGGRLVVLIAGPSSSGKTTFSKRLAIQLRVIGLKPVVLSLDNYYVDREATPRLPDGRYDFEHIRALDLELFNDHLNRLLAGEEIEAPVYNFALGKRDPHKRLRVRLEEGQVLLTEGIHGLNEELTKDVPQEQKFKIYVSALTQLCIDDHNRIPTSDTRLIRRIVRDRKYRGYTAEQTIRQWPAVEAGAAKWIFPYQEDADVMFNSALVYEHAVLATYAIRFLLEVSPETPEYTDASRLLDFLRLFVPILPEEVPPTSILREFIGGSSFSY